MWVFSPAAGFLSAVEHRDNPDYLMVRARDKQSLEDMVAEIELAGNATGDKSPVTQDDIYSEENSDYAYRIVISKATFALYLQFTVLNMLDYKNYKSHAANFRNADWMSSLHGVWSQMLKQDEAPKGTYSTYGEAYDPKRGVNYDQVFSHPYGSELDYGYDPTDAQLREIEGLENYPHMSEADKFDYLNGHFEKQPDATITWTPHDDHEVPMALEDTDGEQFFVQDTKTGNWITVTDPGYTIVADKG